jgi:hypothetical protein
LRTHRPLSQSKRAKKTGGSNQPCSSNESVRTAGPVSYRLRSRIANPRGLPVGLTPKSLGYFYINRFGNVLMAVSWLKRTALKGRLVLTIIRLVKTTSLNLKKPSTPFRAMTNIELELVNDINLDQAFLALARTLAARRSTHRAGAWRLKPIQKHLQHPGKHLDLLASGSAGEDHLAHAARRLLMALELCERTAQARAAGPSSAEAANDCSR